MLAAKGYVHSQIASSSPRQKKVQSFFRLYKARRKKDRIFLSRIDNGVDSISFAS
jgi:hypothetical protein